MRNYRRRVALIPAIAILLASAMYGHAQSPKLNQQETVLTRVRDLLKIAYPELLGQDLSLTLSTTQPFESSWRELFGVRFTLTRYGGGPLPRAESTQYSVVESPKTVEVFGGLVWFDKSGWLRELAVGDFEFVNSQKNTEIRRIADSSSTSQAIEKLKHSGASYGPGDKERFLGHLNLTGLEAFMGSSLRIIYAHFDEDAIGWRVRIEANRRDGPTAFYHLMFEPFGGVLTRIKLDDSSN